MAIPKVEIIQNDHRLGLAMVILVCGGRDFNNGALVYEILDRVHQLLGPVIGLVHGAAKGADFLASEWMKRRIVANRQLWMAGYPAMWDIDGKAAGPIRNQYMLDRHPTIRLVVAFPGGRGTADMVNRARKKGITVMPVGLNRELEYV